MLTDFSWLVDRWPFLLRALWTTLYVSTLSLLLGFAIGILVGGLRSYGGRALDPRSPSGIPRIRVARAHLRDLEP